MQLSVDTTTYPKAQRHPQRHGYQLRGAAPTSVVLHTTNNRRKGTPFDAEARFLLNSPDVSAHYLIGKDGRIVQFLDPRAYQAWHAGAAWDPFRNARSIGIELHVSVGEAPMDAQLAAAAALVRQLAAQFGIPAERIETHRAVALPPGRKTDPEGWSDAAFSGWRARLFAPADPPICGPATCTPAQAIAYLMQSTHPSYTRARVEEIVAGYVEVCGRGGVDLCVAIAQMAHETGSLSSWWSAPPRHNPAGIGVTGRASAVQPTRGAWERKGSVWWEGLAFQNWEVATVAHVGRLLAYAVRPEAATPAQAELIEQALAVRPLPASYCGAAPTVGGLGGRWAVPGTNYGPKLAAIMERMRGL